MTDPDRLKAMQVELAHARHHGRPTRRALKAIAILTAKMEHDELIMLREENARLRQELRDK